MYQPPSSDELNFNQEISVDETSKLSDLLDRAQAENFSPRNVVQRQEQLKRLFMWLIGIGLGLGVIVAIGLVIAIQKLGLAKKPYEVEKQPVQEQVQEQENYLNNLKEVEQQ